MRDTFGLAVMKDELERDEACVLHAYKEPGVGWAIGVGRNLDTQGISLKERETLGITEAMLVRAGSGVWNDPSIPNTITREQAMGLLDFDIQDRVHQLDVRIPWWRLLSPPRQRSLINMAFERGTSGLLKGEPEFMAYLQAGLFDAAAERLAMSGWAKRVPKRAARIVEAIRNG
jgi:lysozyme